MNTKGREPGEISKGQLVVAEEVRAGAGGGHLRLEPGELLPDLGQLGSACG